MTLRKYVIDTVYLLNLTLLVTWVPNMSFDWSRRQHGVDDHMRGPNLVERDLLLAFGVTEEHCLSRKQRELVLQYHGNLVIWLLNMFQFERTACMYVRLYCTESNDVLH